MYLELRVLTFLDPRRRRGLHPEPHFRFLPLTLAVPQHAFGVR